ncbi:MAG: T9SS type A sorting domain-containing protein [Aureispira sp.]|nr:T9SS type A sorting domain-containing protein [Aureispira sp.]
MKTTLHCIFFMASIVVANAQSSSIYLQNNTELEFEIWTEQTGTHTMSSGEWTEKAIEMSVWEMKKEIMETNRNSGVHNNETFYFNVFVASGPDTLQLQMRLKGEFVGSEMDYSLAGPGFDHPWYDDGGSHEESLTFNGVPVRVKYKPDGNDLVWTRNIVFAVHDTRPNYTIDSTDYYNPNIINVLSYNVQFLPFGVSGMGQAAERAGEIPKYISPWQDVVIVQEAFDDGPRNNNLVPAMAAQGFVYKTDIVNNNQFPIWNGGVQIYSRWPIEFEDEYDYKSCDNNAGDCLAAKGVMYARINKMGKKYHVFGTHMEAGGNANDLAAKKEQFGEQRDFIAKQQIPADEAVILGGDMNTDASSIQYQDLLDSLNPIITEHRGWFASTAVDRDTLNIIDHVWSIREHLVPLEGWTKVWILRAIDGDLWDIFDPSDHLPVNGRFVYPMIDTPSMQSPNLCLSDSFSMQVSATDSAFSYQWYKNDTLIVGATDSIYVVTGATVADTGDYKCVIAHEFIVPDTSYLAHPNWPDTARQQFSFDMVSISFTELEMNPTVTQQGDTLLSSSPTSNQWYLDGQAITGATDSMLVVSQDGNYTVLLSEGNCTSDTSNIVNYTQISVVYTETVSGIDVYPNPTTGLLNVNCKETNAIIQILNINGQRLEQFQTTEKQSTLNLSAYPKGVYFIQVLTTKEKYSSKIILR